MYVDSIHHKCIDLYIFQRYCITVRLFLTIVCLLVFVFTVCLSFYLNCLSSVYLLYCPSAFVFNVCLFLYLLVEYCSRSIKTIQNKSIPILLNVKLIIEELLVFVSPLIFVKPIKNKKFYHSIFKKCEIRNRKKFRQSRRIFLASANLKFPTVNRYQH